MTIINMTHFKFFIFKCLLVLLIAIFTGGSCSYFDPELRQMPEGKIPETFSLYSPGPEPPDKWWESFNDKDLNHLMEICLANNLSLKEAWSRLMQSKALAVQAGAALVPNLTGKAGASRARQKRKNTITSKETVKEYSLGLVSSYELDLWGKIRSEQEAAIFQASASREDFNTVAMTLAAEVTEQWINIISQRMQKHLLKEQLKTNMIQFELVKLRFTKAMVSALDVYQQKQVVEKVKAQIPLVEAQEMLFFHKLALLLGKAPDANIKISRNDLPALQELPSIGIPADVLSHRPDIRSAGLKLRAVDWKVAAVRADRLPSINLTASLNLSSDSLDLLLDNWVIGLAGNLTAPIFDGHRRKAEVDRQMALADEKLASYRSTVLTAIKEVEDALISESKHKEHIEALKREIQAAKSALNEARERYRKGLNEYLPVLTQLLSVQNLEIDLIQKKTLLLLDRISLHRALGGTWMKKIEQTL
ncbi:MAG: efflux transporter outer membrane subunit [Thermodesulfobacteriota bacterium]|nr:efflux transporter outer membrane subunit [Thermodesulfobacteriota bacterium]